MPISDPVKTLLEGIIEARAQARQQLVRENIATIIERYGCTMNELSKALDVFAPRSGRGGQSVVSRWGLGTDRPSERHRVLLELLAKGDVALQLVVTPRPKGKRGPLRRKFDVVFGREE